MKSMICDFGCGRLSKYIFSDGKLCCRNKSHKCPGKDFIGPRPKTYSEEYEEYKKSIQEHLL